MNMDRTIKWVGLLLWPGALFFTIYNYMVYILVMPLNLAFVIQLFLITLSSYCLIALIAMIKSEIVQSGLSGKDRSRNGGRCQHERAAQAADHGSGCIYHCRISQHSLSQRDQSCCTSGSCILFFIVLYNPSGSFQVRHERAFS